MPSEPSDTQGDIAMIHDERAVRLYRVTAAGCAALVTTIEAQGRMAIAALGEPTSGDMPIVGVDTWRMHGDRLRKHDTWSGRVYVPDMGTDVPGPEKFRPRK